MNTNNNISVQVLVNGRPVKTYNHNGKTFIEGRNKTRYTIRVHNNRNERVCAIVSVDGLDVLTGKAATDDARGYIIPGNSYADVKGFRVSDNEVGEFQFSTKQNSYARTKGKVAAQNVGIIGVIAYTEKETPSWEPFGLDGPRITRAHTYTYTYTTPTYTTPEYPRCSSPRRSIVGDISLDHDDHPMAYSACCGANINCASEPMRGTKNKGIAPEFDMGTTWGARIADRVTTDYFERGYGLPIVAIYYASRDSLVEIGIDLSTSAKVERQFPNAFPGQYAEPPKGWTPKGWA